MTNEELIQQARAVVNPRKIAHGFTVGDVGCALLTDKGNLHLGVCIDVAGGIGFCAEHSAIASMITHGEQSIRKIVAVLGDGTILPPCGVAASLCVRSIEATWIAQKSYSGAIRQ